MKHGRSLVVEGSTIYNSGSENKWMAAVGEHSFSSGVHRFDVKIVCDAGTTNTWKMCIGLVSSQFDATSPKGWLGGPGTYAYIAGTGGKAHIDQQSQKYGRPFTTNDVVSVIADFENHTVGSFPFVFPVLSLLPLLLSLIVFVSFCRFSLTFGSLIHFLYYW